MIAIILEPFTPKQHSAWGMSEPIYRAKLQIALALVWQAVVVGLPFADAGTGGSPDIQAAQVVLVPSRR